jgi:hypothetical protein
MGYPRAGMIDFSKLLGASLVGLLRSHAAREAEMAFLRLELLVLEAIRASEAQAAPSRSTDLCLALSAVPVPARGCGHLQARDAGALASARLPSLLALEVAPSPIDNQFRGLLQIGLA